MVSSLDGYVAKKDGSISWMQSADTYDKGKTLTEEDITSFLNKIDCYLMGSKTYEHALTLGWPYGDVSVTVLTKRNLQTERDNVTFYSGDLNALVNKRLRPTHKNIWMVGGPMVTREFLRQQLADEIVITIMPILLGEGTPFFEQLRLEQRLHLKDVTPYNDGMVEMCYEIQKG